MEKVRLKNFRCFRDEQTARLAPLTLLVGENSTGKTSFLALIRALWDISFVRAAPNFKEAPYDLGSFDEIVHNRGRSTSTEENIEAGCVFGSGDTPYRFDAMIVRHGAFPRVARWRMARGDASIEESRGGITARSIRFETRNGRWNWSLPPKLDHMHTVLGAEVLSLFRRSYSEEVFTGFVPESGAVSLGEDDREQFSELLSMFDSEYLCSETRDRSPVRPYAPDRAGPTIRLPPFGIPKERTYRCIFPRCFSNTRSRGSL